MNRPQSRILDAIDALEHHDRRRAAALIADELRFGEPTGKKWGSVYKLADKIGEIDMALDASLRATQTPPTTLTSVIAHCGNLTKAGRSEEAVEMLDRLPPEARAHPAALHFYGMVASENGEFDKAQDYFREALSTAPMASDSWFALAMVKKFEPGDPDLEQMASIEPMMEKTDSSPRARYYYCMAKALVDVGEIEKGFDYYAKGASLRREEDPYDRQRQEKMTEALIRDFTPEALASLKPSKFQGQRALFVNGLPRSGTTMVESILCSHSQVSDGGELNLVKTALIPTDDYTLAGAKAYEGRFEGDDPWGQTAEDYHHLLAQRFREGGLIVDKTLSQSYFMGLLLHIMPEAKILWLRRRPEDVALSVYRTLFSSTVRWSWSWEDIAHQMKLEDRLYDHWREMYPDRILTLPYEEVVSDPDLWIPKILDHAGLPLEPQVKDFHKNRRKVRTASVKQVRAPISTSAIGKSDRFAAQLEPFRKAYYG